MTTYIVTIAVPAGWFASDKLVQIELKHPETKELRARDIAEQVRALKKYPNFKVIGAIKK